MAWPVDCLGYWLGNRGNVVRFPASALESTQPPIRFLRWRFLSGQSWRDVTLSTNVNVVLRLRRPLGKPKRRWEDNVKMDLREVGWGAWTALIWLRIGTGGGLL
jgi:hypothetical protein